VFANCREEDEIHPLSTAEIAKAQKKDQEILSITQTKQTTPEKDMFFQLMIAQKCNVKMAN
jgi:hypothetical protein